MAQFGKVRRSKRTGCIWYFNALVVAAETKNKLSLWMKTASFTNLWYFFPLVKRVGAIKS